MYTDVTLLSDAIFTQIDFEDEPSVCNFRIYPSYIRTYYGKLLAYSFDVRSPRACLEVGFRAAALAGALRSGLRRRR